VKRTKSSGNHPGPVKWLARSSYAAAPSGQGGDDPTPAVLPWVATQGRTFLAEQGHYIRVLYYKDGQSPCEAHHLIATKQTGQASRSFLKKRTKKLL
jgi:hypothetical protein